MLKNLDQEIIKLAQQFAEQTGVPANVIRVVVSPYRICPIGAHSDHQGGPVLGMAISAYTLLAFAPAPNMELTLTSANYPGEVRMNLKESSTIAAMGWSRYAHSAAQAFAEEIGETPRALIGHVTGSLPDGGLSSSASVILAYLAALAEVNAVEFEPRRLVQLALHADKLVHNLYFDPIRNRYRVFANTRHRSKLRIRPQLKDAAQNLTTDILAARIMIREHTFGRRQNGYPKAVIHFAKVLYSRVNPLARTRNALNFANDRFTLVIFKLDRQFSDTVA